MKTMTATSKWFLSLSLAVAALACPWGCSSDGHSGYTMESPYRHGISTVAVPIWQRGSKEFRRDIEIQLTDALVKTIQAETPYRIVDRTKADTILEGTLVRITQHVLSFDPNNAQAREIEITMIVDFTWKDLRTGRILAEKKNFRASSTYIPLEPFSEDFFLGNQDVLNKIALRIVEQMQEPW